MNIVASCLVVVGGCIAPSLAAAAPDASVAASVAAPDVPAVGLTDSLPAHRITGESQIEGRLDEPT